MQVWLRGGKAKPLLVGSKDLDSVRDNAKARGILQKLADTTNLRYRGRPPDPSASAGR